MNNVLALQNLEIECLDIAESCTACLSIISSDAGIEDGMDQA
ncbi:hypothetical protein [Stenotrophomonas maltophilia]|nr:hypothetical protein [Stenotrophomonas maltophilia]